ncbi:MAG: metallophosphoesterase family protein [Candidatus Omnitrophota bacterium]
MKIGVISDTHIPDRCEHLPFKVLDAFKGVDMVIHAGDLVNLRVIEELKSVCPKVIVVSGNMDEAEIVNKFPAKQILNVSGLKIGITHGLGAPQFLVGLLKDTFKNDNCDIIVFGHSHKAMNERIGKTLFFNPGSATDCLDREASFGLIEIDGKITANIIKI